jgi:hypothetical protein
VGVESPGRVSESSIDTSRHRDLVGRRRGPWVRRLLLTLFVAFLVVALGGVLGQGEQTHSADATAARLEVRSPGSLRGGLLYQTRFIVTAKQDLAKPKLVLNAGYLNGLTLNTTEPSAAQELSRNGDLVLEYNAIKAGGKLVVWFDYQVNPTTVGRRRETVELDDGATPLARVSREVVILP